MADSQNCSTSGVVTHGRRFLRGHAIFSMTLRGEQEYGGQWYQYHMGCTGCSRGCTISFMSMAPTNVDFQPFAYAETVAGAHFSLCKKLAEATAIRSGAPGGQNPHMSPVNREE